MGAQFDLFSAKHCFNSALILLSVAPLAEEAMSLSPPGGRRSFLRRALMPSGRSAGIALRDSSLGWAVSYHEVKGCSVPSSAQLKAEGGGDRALEKKEGERSSGEQEHWTHRGIGAQGSKPLR